MPLVRFRDIPDVIGGAGVSSNFKRVFREWIAVNKQGITPEKQWEELWRIFDKEYSHVSDLQLARVIITWFVEKVDPGE